MKHIDFVWYNNVFNATHLLLVFERHISIDFASKKFR